jgi:hypothetical protein
VKPPLPQPDAALARARRLLHDHRTRAKKEGAALDYGLAAVMRNLWTCERVFHQENPSVAASGSRKLDPWKARQGVLRPILVALAAGRTLRQAAAAGGVHVATLCRWQARSPAVAGALALARQQALRPRRPPADPQLLYQQRPNVPWHPRCPHCGWGVEIWRERGWYWWECTGCSWRSWRPRHPVDCPQCCSWRLWSWDRRSVVCAGCGVRLRAAHDA